MTTCCLLLELVNAVHDTNLQEGCSFDACQVHISCRFEAFRVSREVIQGCADVSVGSQFLDPDGWFPNHVPNPEDKAAMIAGVRAVNSSHADLGIVVDTDVDRSAVVAGNGTPINSNRYIALMAYIALRSAGHPHFLGVCEHFVGSFLPSERAVHTSKALQLDSEGRSCICPSKLQGGAAAHRNMVAHQPTGNSTTLWVVSLPSGWLSCSAVSKCATYQELLSLWGLKCKGCQQDRAVLSQSVATTPRLTAEGKNLVPPAFGLSV
jgi:hypothetical protein